METNSEDIKINDEIFKTLGYILQASWQEANINLIYVNNNDVIIRTYGKFNNDIVQSESSCIAALTYIYSKMRMIHL